MVPKRRTGTQSFKGVVQDFKKPQYRPGTAVKSKKNNLYFPPHLPLFQHALIFPAGPPAATPRTSQTPYIQSLASAVTCHKCKQGPLRSVIGCPVTSDVRDISAGGPAGNTGALSEMEQQQLQSRAQAIFLQTEVRACTRVSYNLRPSLQSTDVV